MVGTQWRDCKTWWYLTKHCPYLPSRNYFQETPVKNMKTHTQEHFLHCCGYKQWKQPECSCAEGMSRSQCMLGEYYSCKNMRTSGENTEGKRASLACYLTCKKGRQVRNHAVNLQEVVGMRRERTRIGEQK